MHNIKKYLIALIVGIAMTGFVGAPILHAQGLVNNPFGGFITFVRPCLCSGNMLINIIPAKTGLPLSLVFQPGISRLFMFGQLRPGVHALGTHAGRAPCLHIIPLPPFCVPDPTAPLMSPVILMIGTSL